jgi:hypothetical protein
MYLVANRTVIPVATAGKLSVVAGVDAFSLTMRLGGKSGGVVV